VSDSYIVVVVTQRLNWPHCDICTISLSLHNIVLFVHQSCPVPEENVRAILHSGISKLIHVSGQPQQDHTGTTPSSVN